MIFIISFLFLCINSGFGQDLSDLKHPSVNDSAGFDRDIHKLVGGSPSSIKNHPYQVAIFYNGQIRHKIYNDLFRCGGFIISRDHILTAAHCLELIRDPRTVFARAGSTVNYNGRKISISQVRIHPHYDTLTVDKDVGVMTTVAPIEFNDVIKAIPLPKNGRRMKKGTNIVVSGWGWTSDDSPGSGHLMDVKAPVVDLALCSRSYKLTRNMFCAGNYYMGGQVACSGDSGGAATQAGMAVGIVSFGGASCMAPHYPTVYVNIASPAVRDFITQETGV